MKRVDLLRAALEQHKAGELAAARKLYEQLLVQEPNHPEGLNFLGVLLAQSNEPRLAITYLARAVQLRPQDYRALNNLGNAYRAAGDVSQAIATYQQALVIQPQAPETLLNLGIAHTELGELDLAIANLEHALSLNPRNVRLLLALGDLWQLQKRWLDAIHCYIQALRLAPHAADLLLPLGMAFFRLGNLPDAAKAFTEVLRLEPAQATALTNLGAVLVEMGELERATAAYRGVVQLVEEQSDTNPSAYCNLGLVLRQQTQYDEAAAQFSRALQADPACLPAFLGLGEVYRAQGQYAVAIATYQQALAAYPEQPEIWVQQGITHLAAADPAAAIPVLQHALSLAPRHTRALATLAQAHADQPDVLATLLPTEHIQTYDSGTELDLEALAGYVGQHPTLLTNRPGKPLHQGAQTYELLQAEAPVVTALKSYLTACLNDYWAHYPQLAPGGDWELSGWGVVLSSEGYQDAHIHPESICSGVLYCAVPPEITSATDEAGCLRFSLPPALVRPTPGKLVIFPSSYWHGTVPFRAETPRICISFNVISVE